MIICTKDSVYSVVISVAGRRGRAARKRNTRRKIILAYYGVYSVSIGVNPCTYIREIDVEYSIEQFMNRFKFNNLNAKDLVRGPKGLQPGDPFGISRQNIS